MKRHKHSILAVLAALLWGTYEELLKLGSDKYTVKLKSFPSGINQIRIVPEQVDFLIEQITYNVD